MNILKKIKKRWSQNKQKKTEKLSPEVQRLAYEWTLESLLEIMEPNNWGVAEKGDLFQLRFKDEKWYSDRADSKEPGLFTEESKAWEAIGKIVEKAAKDFDDVVKAIKDMPDA